MSSSAMALGSGELPTFGLLAAAVLALWWPGRRPGGTPSALAALAAGLALHFGFFTYPALAVG